MSVTRSIGAVLILLAIALLGVMSACSSNMPEVAQVATETQTELPTETATRDIFKVTPATRDPEIGPPTLPPTFTPTSTFTPTPTLSPTPTASITPTPSLDDLCEAIQFPMEAIDGMSFPDDGGSPFYVSIDIPFAQLNWTVTNLDSGESRVLTIPGGYTTIVVPGNVSDPGRYEWRVTVTTDGFMDVCERKATVIIEEPPPEPVDMSAIGAFLRGLLGLDE